MDIINEDNNMNTATALHMIDAPFTKFNRSLLVDDLLNAGYSSDAIYHFVEDGCFCELEYELNEQAEQAQGLYDMGYEQGYEAAIKDSKNKLAFIIGVLSAYMD